MSRSWWLRIWALVAIVALAGCASFPNSGPIERVSDAGPGGRPPGIDVAAQPPLPGASPEAILEGFFAASESPGDGYLVARQYLTPEVAGSWRPESGIQVYDSTGQSRVVTADGAAVLRAPLVGRVDADHVFTAAHEPDFTHNFHMTKVSGEWRIANPGEGILMSLQRFHRAFQQVPIYYFDPTGTRLISQHVFLRQGDIDLRSPDALVRAVIGGPGAWLRPAVLDPLPAEVESSGTFVDEQGIARLSLSEEMEALSADHRHLAAVQLLWTLSSFEAIRGLQITVNGRPLSIDSADQDGVVPISVLDLYPVERPEAPRDLYGIRDSSVIMLSDATDAQVAVLPGALGGGWEDVPGWLAVDWQGDRLAVVSQDAQRLYVANTADGAPTLLYSGEQLTKPQFDASGQLWTIDNTAGGPVAVRIGAGGKPVLLPLPELASASVVAFRISPDRTRIAAVVQFGQVQRLGLLRLRGVDQLTIDGWRELPINTSRGVLTALRDIAFISAERMLVLGAGERDPQFMVYSLDVDAAQVTSQGPISDVDAISLSAMPLGTLSAVAVVTSTNRGLRYEAQYRWPALLDDVTDLAYPS